MICNKCFQDKPEELFRIDSRTKKGRQGRCKACAKISDVKFREKNTQKIKAQHQKHYQENTAKIKKRAKDWEADNLEYVKNRKKEYRANNSVKISEYQKEYANINRENLTKYLGAYRKERLKSDIDFQATVSMQRILHRTIRQTSGTKDERTKELLGYTASDLRAHLESTFKDGMNWADRSKWHIDHIKPISIFIKEGIKDPSVINALSNLQPLWAGENMAKSDNY